MGPINCVGPCKHDSLSAKRCLAGGPLLWNVKGSCHVYEYSRHLVNTSLRFSVLYKISVVFKGRDERVCIRGRQRGLPDEEFWFQLLAPGVYTHSFFPPPLKLSRDARDVTAPAPRRVIALRINWETCGFTGWTLIVLLREKINVQLLRFMCTPCNQSPTMRKCVKNYGGRYFECFTAVVLSGAKSGSFFKSQLC